MFTELINANERMPDFRAGSTPVLAGKTSHNDHLVLICRSLRCVLRQFHFDGERDDAHSSVDLGRSSRDLHSDWGTSVRRWGSVFPRFVVDFDLVEYVSSRPRRSVD